jgi:hypothetical protein
MPDETTGHETLRCLTCGAPNFYVCGCYDRCRCDHDRRSHTPSGVCTHVGCDCLHGLHGYARRCAAGGPASPGPVPA